MQNAFWVLSILQKLAEQQLSSKKKQFIDFWIVLADDADMQEDLMDRWLEPIETNERLMKR